MSGGDVMVIIAVLGQFGLVGLILQIVFRRAEQKAALRAQLELKLIERFNTAKELEEFLSTEAGRRLLGGHSRHGGSSLGKIVGTMQIGVALLVVALGLLILAFFLGHKGPFAAGIIVFSVGAGLLAAASLGRRLIRAWGLAAPEAEPPSRA